MNLEYIEDKDMYHFHRIGVYDDVWKEKSELEVDSNFESFYSHILNNFNTNLIDKNNNIISFENLISKYLEEDLDIDILKQLLILAKEFISETDIFKREIALENVRTNISSSLPSRKHSIWVTDINGIEYWSKVFSDSNIKAKLYKVSLTGNIFKTSEYFIPSDKLIFKDYIQEAYNYWNPNFNNIKNDRNEYLFQGKIKVKNHIKTI